jgi:hypothetical protein
MKHDRAARPLSSDAITRRPIPATGAALLAAMLLATAACSKDTTVYPSLGIRPAESIGFAEPEVKTVVAKPDPALDSDIAKIKAQFCFSLIFVRTMAGETVLSQDRSNITIELRGTCRRGRRNDQQEEDHKA